MREYRGRRAATIENDALRVTVLEEGGHIAEITDRASGVNPLWTPPWPSIEPSAYDAARHPEYGGGAEASLLAGIMGHNLCLDIFGGPSAEEAAAGFPVHGEVSVARFDVDAGAGTIAMRTTLPSAQLRLERRIVLEGRTVRVRESVENLTSADRPVGWTQHVTMGPPFLENGVTEFRLSADRSLVYPGPFGPADYLVAGAEFVWPHAPLAPGRRSLGEGSPGRRSLGEGGPGRRSPGEGSTADLRVYNSASASSAYTAHRMDVARDTSFFIAYSPRARLAFGYWWKRADFPWTGIWEENRARAHAPWNGRTLTCGLEFGVSPIPESRREMIERGRLFDTPTFRWIPAGRRIEVEYCAMLRSAPAIPDAIEC